MHSCHATQRVSPLVHRSQMTKREVYSAAHYLGNTTCAPLQTILIDSAQQTGRGIFVLNGVEVERGVDLGWGWECSGLCPAVHSYFLMILIWLKTDRCAKSSRFYLGSVKFFLSLLTIPHTRTTEHHVVFFTSHGMSLWHTLNISNSYQTCWKSLEHLRAALCNLDKRGTS